MIRLKPGVSLDRCVRQVFYILACADPVWQAAGAEETWVTGANEDGHSTGPRGFHRLPDGTCQAVDLRTWNIPTLDARHRAVKQLAAILGPSYDVLYEKPGQRGEHAHVQWDPRGLPGTST